MNCLKQTLTKSDYYKKEERMVSFSHNMIQSEETVKIHHS